MDEIQRLAQDVDDLKRLNGVQSKHIDSLNDILQRMAVLLQTALHRPEELTKDAYAHADIYTHAILSDDAPIPLAGTITIEPEPEQTPDPETTDSPTQGDFLEPTATGGD
jgi:hypothetical protein